MIKKNQLLNLITVFIIYLAAQFSIVIPIIMFKINIQNTSSIVLALLNLFPGVILMIFLYFKYKEDLANDFKILKNNIKNYIDSIFSYWLSGMVLMAISNSIIIRFSPVKEAANEVGIRNLFGGAPFITLISILIIAPFTEELMFRKAFKDIFHNKYLFIIMSGISFGLIHIIGSYEVIYDMIFIVPYGVLGGAFAALYYKTNNIFAPIFAHFIHNVFAVLIIVFLS